MKTKDETPVVKTESERLDELDALLDSDFGVISRALTRLRAQVRELQVEVADLRHQRAVSSHRETNQDPEWYA